MPIPFIELKNESQKILDAAYTNHSGILQMCVIGRKWVMKVKDKKVVNVPADDADTRTAWDAAIIELRDNQYIKPHLETYKVTEQGYICVENKNR